VNRTARRPGLPLLAAAAVLLAGCAITQAPPPVPAEPPRLVVLLVVDGLPQRQVTGYRDQLGPDGFNRFLQRGAWFAQAHYGHAYTTTAPGHATILTGAYPHRTGIIGNEWRDPATGAPVYCTGDGAHGYLGHATGPLAGTSPRRLVAETVGDVLRRAEPRSKVVAVSGKDRGAILLAGHAGSAYIYMRQTGRFASTSYYMPRHPAWVDAFNDRKLADGLFGAHWTPLLPEMAYARSLADGQPWYAPGGTLPKVIGAGLNGPGPRFYEALLASPLGDALTLDFARAAVAGESLGADEAPDILAVSLSGHDYVNHAWGAESRLSHDHVLQVDALLAAFFRDLDRTVGRDRYLAVLTSDHGFMPVPEHAASLGRDAGRRNVRELLATLEAGLARRFGEGPWVRGWSAYGVLLERARARQRGIGEDALGQAAREILEADPAIAAAFPRAEIEDAGAPARPFLAEVRRSWHRERSADVMLVPKAGWIFGSGRTGTTHGSPHRDDTHVPILLHGPKWVRPGRVDGRVEVADLAPTLARILGIAAPAAAEGRALPVGP